MVGGWGEISGLARLELVEYGEVWGEPTKDQRGAGWVSMSEGYA